MNVWIDSYVNHQERELIGSRDAQAEMSVRDRERLRYGGPLFSATSGLPLTGLAHPKVVVKLVAAVARRPRRLAALIALILRTPREYVVLSDSREGQALARYFNQRQMGILKNRLCRGVLLLPDDHAEYLRGRRRHALRNNLRRATAAGIRCEILTDPSVGDTIFAIMRHQWSRSSAAHVRRWTNHFSSLFERPEVTVMTARDQDGDVLALLAATIDDSVCAIHFAMAIRHEARWALHGHLVLNLIARRVRYLVAADEGLFGALGYSTNIRRYQHLLGYELRHITPVRGQPRHH